jgi:hypothetical protein
MVWIEAESRLTLLVCFFVWVINDFYRKNDGYLMLCKVRKVPKEAIFAKNRINRTHYISSRPKPIGSLTK